MNFFHDLRLALRRWRLRGLVRHFELVAADAEKQLDYAITKHSDDRNRARAAASAFHRELETLDSPHPQL